MEAYWRGTWPAVLGPMLAGGLVGVVTPILSVMQGPVPRSEVPGLTRWAFPGSVAAPAFPSVFLRIVILTGILPIKCVHGGGDDKVCLKAALNSVNLTCSRSLSKQAIVLTNAIFAPSEMLSVMAWAIKMSRMLTLPPWLFSIISQFLLQRLGP